MSPDSRSQELTRYRWLFVIAIFLLGVLPRLWLLPLPNDDDDMFFQDWAARTVEHGVGRIYELDIGSQNDLHPPLNYYALYASGEIYKSLFATDGNFDETSIALMVLIKLPNLICDCKAPFVWATKTAFL